MQRISLLPGRRKKGVTGVVRNKWAAEGGPQSTASFGAEKKSRVRDRELRKEIGIERLYGEITDNCTG